MTAQDIRRPPGRYRLTVDDYMTLDEAGAFAGLKTELVEGDVLIMSPQYRPHAFVKMALYDRLRDALRATVSPLYPMSEVSLLLDDHNMPAPDLLLTGEPRGKGPVPLASVALAIEVADTTLAENLGAKAAIYARCGVPEYWVADVRGRVIHQMWRPEGEAYAERREVPAGERITAATIAGLAVDTADL